MADAEGEMRRGEDVSLKRDETETEKVSQSSLRQCVVSRRQAIGGARCCKKRDSENERRRMRY